MIAGGASPWTSVAPKRDPVGETLEQRLAIGEVAVHGRLRHAGPLGDLAGRDLVGRLLGQQLGQRIEDEIPRALRLAVSQGGGVGAVRS